MNWELPVDTVLSNGIPHEDRLWSQCCHRDFSKTPSPCENFVSRSYDLFFYFTFIIGTVRVGDYDHIMDAILKAILFRIVNHNRAPESPEKV